MKRRLLSLLLLLFIGSPGWAQSPAEPTRLVLHPKAAPVPSLKYLLLPELGDQTTGNRALLYYRAYSPELWSNLRQPKVLEDLEKALKMPLEKVREEASVPMPLHMLKEVDRGARHSYIDWELTSELKKKGIGLLLPDLPGFPEISRWLAWRARREMAQGQYDKAFYTFQTGCQLGRDVSKGPTLIHGLVGIAITQTQLDQLQELMQHPEAPNCYWALTELPTPFIDFRTGLQGEKLALEGTLPGIEHIETRPLTAQELQTIQMVMRGLLWDTESGFSGDFGQFKFALMAAKNYEPAKKALLAQGRKPSEVEALPVFQVVAIYSLQHYRRLRDDMFRWANVPYWQARPGIERVNQELKEMKQQMTEGLPLATLLLPGIDKAMLGQARLERRIAALRCIEAIRLYAAEHDGKLPATLNDITQVPVPIDPVTGKPFDYHSTGNQATLTGPPPPGQTPSSGNTVQYELKLKS